MDNDKKGSWISAFFGGMDDYYGRTYAAMGLLGRKETNREVNGVMKLLQPKAGSHILDWCGGWGRHAVPLAKRGFKLTVLDFSEEYLERARVYAKRKGVSLNLVHADFRETPSDIKADYAVNLFTAGLGYLSAEDDVIALRSLHGALQKGGRILIDTRSLFWIVKNWRSEGWRVSRDGTKRELTHRTFDFWRNATKDTRLLHHLKSGKEETRDTEICFYSPATLAAALRSSGFVPQKFCGDFDGSPFTFDSQHLIMVAEKR